jgi:hypothetical protein
MTATQPLPASPPSEPRRPRRAGATAAFAALLAGCSGFDFARARLPDGSPDSAKMIAALAHQSLPSLSDGIWIPLLWMDIEIFAPTHAWEPAGFRWQRTRAIGPLFCFGSAEQRLFDRDGTQFEQRGEDWGAWGLGWSASDSRVVTAHGTRFEGDLRVLGVLGWHDEPTYVGDPRGAEPEPTATPAETPARQ